MKPGNLSHDNNFNLLRLLFAVLVLVTHAYLLAGFPEEDYLFQISNGRFSFSYVGVRGFFIISGFLVYQSLLRSSNVVSFFKKRIARIFPGLISVLLGSILIGAVITTLNSLEYFSSVSTWKYFGTNLQLFLRITTLCLPGVFDFNPHNCTVNGSLWTISYEVLFYSLLSIFFLIRQQLKVSRVLIGITFIILFAMRCSVHERWETLQYIVPYTNFGLSHLIELGLYFVAGMLIKEFESFVEHFRKQFMIVSIAALLPLVFFDKLTLIVYLVFPLFVILLGKTNSGRVTTFFSQFDFSYGIYLWGFPVQQFFISQFNLNYLELMAVSIPVSILLGALSWFLVEKRFLKRAV